MKYAVLGGGRWASIMRDILSDMGKEVVSFQVPRIREGEETQQYIDRLTESFYSLRVQCAWICITPGPHIEWVCLALIGAGINFVAEKPWLIGSAKSADLLDFAERRGLVAWVHYEYCCLKAVENLKRLDLSGVVFSGAFSTSQKPRDDIPAEVSLGQHIMSIREYALRRSMLGKFTYAFSSADQREISVSRAGEGLIKINFLNNREPLIQRFVELFEGAINLRAWSGTFDIDFASRVSSMVTRSNLLLHQKE